MCRNIKIVIIGLGATGSDAVRHLIEKRGIEIVGAVASERSAGMDVGEKVGLPPMGMKVETDLAALLERTHPDIAMISTKTALNDVFDDIKTCVEHGVDVVTSSEEAYYYMRANAEAGMKLDELAKKHGVTILGTGVQDVFFSTLPAVLMSSCYNVKRIHGENYAILDDLGRISNEMCNVGATKEEFEKKVASEKGMPPNAFTISLYDVAKSMGLTVTGETETKEPIVSRHGTDLYCPAYDEMIPAGKLIGTRYHSELKTAEGLQLEVDFCEKLSEDGETGICKWEVQGEPDLELSMPDMRGDLTTAATMVARIPDVLNAEPGFLTVADLPPAKYYVHDLNQYVELD